MAPFAAVRGICTIKNNQRDGRTAAPGAREWAGSEADSRAEASTFDDSVGRSVGRAAGGRFSSSRDLVERGGQTAIQLQVGRTDYCAQRRAVQAEGGREGEAEATGQDRTNNAGKNLFLLHFIQPGPATIQCVTELF